MASSSCNKSFCSNYMLLKPEECSVLDLARILFSSNKNLGKKEFVDCPNEEMTKEPLSRRWVIFISILVQKILLATAKPLAGFGNAIEYWLNLQNVNGGFFRLIFNSLRGKAVSPDKESAYYLSFIGNMDKRVELDFSKIIVEEIGGGRRYDEAISMMAAKAAYENKACIQTTVNDHWKMDLVAPLTSGMGISMIMGCLKIGPARDRASENFDSLATKEEEDRQRQEMGESWHKQICPK